MLDAAAPEIMVGHDRRDLHRQKAARGPVEEVVEAMPALAHHHQRAQFYRQVVNVPFKAIGGGDRPEPMFETFHRHPDRAGEGDAHEKTAAVAIAELGVAHDVAILRGDEAGDRRNDPLTAETGYEQHKIGLGLRNTISSKRRLEEHTSELQSLMRI